MRLLACTPKATRSDTASCWRQENQSQLSTRLLRSRSPDQSRQPYNLHHVGYEMRANGRYQTVAHEEPSHDHASGSVEGEHWDQQARIPGFRGLPREMRSSEEERDQKVPNPQGCCVSSGAPETQPDDPGQERHQPESEGDLLSECCTETSEEALEDGGILPSRNQGVFRH